MAILTFLMVRNVVDGVAIFSVWSMFAPLSPWRPRDRAPKHAIASSFPQASALESRNSIPPKNYPRSMLTTHMISSKLR